MRQKLTYHVTAEGYPLCGQSLPIAGKVHQTVLIGSLDMVAPPLPLCVDTGCSPMRHRERIMCRCTDCVCADVRGGRAHREGNMPSASMHFTQCAVHDVGPAL